MVPIALGHPGSVSTDVWYLEKVLQMVPCALRPRLLQIDVWLQVLSGSSTAWSGACAHGAVGGCPGGLVFAERL